MRIVAPGSIVAWSLLCCTSSVLAQTKPAAPPPAAVAAPAQPAPAAAATDVQPTTTAPAAAPAPAPPPPPPVVVLDVEPSPSGDRSALAKDGHPMAGWHNGIAYLRDTNDNFRIYVQGRAQVDAYTYFGPGVGSSALKNTILLRRIRPELTGEFLHLFTWSLAGDWGTTAFDNPKGTNETSAAAPGKAPTNVTAKYAGAQTASIKAAPTDVFLNFRPDPVFNLQFGQFDAPFTMENRTSDKFIPFMERSLAVRAVGIPTNKEIGLMAWGETSGKHFSYALGPFLGDGQNRPNADNNADIIGRVFVHPLASMEGTLKDLQIGVSFRDGARNSSTVNYDYATMATQGAFNFWTPTYTSSVGAYPGLTTHVIPAGNQLGVAGEIRVPVSIVDLTSEFVYINNGTREALDGFQATNSERFGNMSGYSYYIQFGIWPMGKRDVSGLPGYENPAHLDFSTADPAAPPHALQLLAKWEQLNVKYDSASKSGVADPKGIDGSIKVNALSFGANYYFTKHVRLTANYVANFFPGSAPTSPTTKAVMATGTTPAVAASPTWSSDQRALAPGNTLPIGVDDDARNNAHILHELLFRVAVAL